MSKYIGCWFGLAEAAEENGEMRIAHAFDAVNDKQAKAKAALLFMEAFPDADDSHFEFRLYAEADGVPCPAEEWDETFLYDHEWDHDAGHPVAKTQIKPVAFNELQEPLRIAILTKYHTTDISHDQLAPAIQLLQDDASTFDGHIVEAITKMPAIASMYPERILEAIQYVRVNCPPNTKWPEIKAALSGWQKSHEEERKEGNVQIISDTEYKPGSGNPDRFDVVVALLVMGKDPSKAGATDVKNAKHIKETRDPAWRGWRTTLVGIPGIYDFPEQLLYELTLDGMKDLSLIENNEARLAYVREHFGGHQLLPDYLLDEDDNHETEQNTAASTDSLAHESSETTAVAPQHSDDVPATGTVETAPPVERTGPFYYRTADGQPGRANKMAKLEAVIEQGCIEITKEEYQALKEAPPVQQPTSSDQPGINNLGNGRFSIEGLAPEQQQTDEKIASNEVEKTEVAATQPPATTFQSIGAALEHDLAEKGDNMKIWRSVMRTDPRYTKDLAGAGFEGTSINAEYMIMRATEIFGPIGTGWGFEVLEDRMLPGAPMSEAIYEDKKFVGNRLLRDGDGTLITEQNHSIKIAFWYLKDNGVAERFEAYGATKYLYKTKHGITCDGEAQKKSLTDAIKKALSLLGFSADVWLGLYDQAEYKQENATEFAIKNASEKAEDVSRLRNELDEKLTRVANTIENAVSPNEAKKVFDTLAREVEVHRKAAEAKGDSEHAKYLSGRLRRLNQIKDQRIQALTDAEASNA